MKNWLRRLRGGFGIGLIWAAGGAFIGGMIELFANFVPGVLWISGRREAPGRTSDPTAWQR